MEVTEAKEKLRELENLISRQVIAFEKETGMIIQDIDVTRLTTINEHPNGPSYVVIRAEL
jgi:hypothetical protein